MSAPPVQSLHVPFSKVFSPLWYLPWVHSFLYLVIWSGYTFIRPLVIEQGALTYVVYSYIGTTGRGWWELFGMLLTCWFSNGLLM